MEGPSQGSQYRLAEPTLGIHTDASGNRVPITIPRNAIVTVIDGDVNGNTFCRVEWEGKEMFIFAIDLRTRGVRIGTATA